MCDFEALDLCGFTQREDDMFDWIRGTARDESGLLNDHTSGDIFGERVVISIPSFFFITCSGQINLKTFLRYALLCD